VPTHDFWGGNREPTILVRSARCSQRHFERPGNPVRSPAAQNVKLSSSGARQAEAPDRNASPAPPPQFPENAGRKIASIAFANDRVLLSTPSPGCFLYNGGSAARRALPDHVRSGPLSRS